GVGGPRSAFEYDIAGQRPGAAHEASSCCVEAPRTGRRQRKGEVVSTAVGTIEELLAEAAGALAPSLQGEHVLASAPAAGHPFVAAALAVATGAPVLAVAPDPRSAQTLADGAAAWLGGERAVLFPAWEALPYEGISPGPLTAG